MSKPRIIFIATSQFALPILQSLVGSGYDIISVITAPDKPAGRKNIPAPSPVKLLAQRLELNILQPEKIKSAASDIKKLAPDLIITASYGQIIPQEILDIAKYKSINIHPSLLPKYRGPSPIQTAILNNDKTTGVSLMLMDAEMDHGPILAQKQISVTSNDTYLTLEKRLAENGADLLITTLPEYLAGNIKPKDQDHDQATYTKILTRQDGFVNLGKETARQIILKMRAFTPWPGIWTIIGNKRVKIIQSEFSKNKTEASLATKDGYLNLIQVQPEGKKPMSGADFIRGYKI